MVRNLSNVLAQIERGLTTRAQLLMENSDRPTNLTQALLDAVDLFETLNIRYALIGGFAAMVYGRQRPTEDVDFVANPDFETVLARNQDVMRRFRFDPSCTYMHYHDSGATIDLWKDEHVPGELERARQTELAGRKICVVDPHDLIAMKLRSNQMEDRSQDDYDIAEVLRHAAIEENIIQQRVTTEQFEHFLALKRRYGREKSA